MIAEELAKAEAQLSATPRGMKLLLRYHTLTASKSHYADTNSLEP